MASKPLNPWPRCFPPSCTLRVGCLVIGVIEVVTWAMVIIVVASVLAAVGDAVNSKNPQSFRSSASQDNLTDAGISLQRMVIKSLRKSKPGQRLIKPDFARDNDQLDSFIIIGAMFVGASITAGLILIFGVLYRAGILCLIHCGFAAFIVVLLMFLVVLEIVAGSFYTLVSSAILILPYGYFGLCSFALYTQIQARADMMRLRKRGSVGVQEPVVTISTKSVAPATSDPVAMASSEDGM